MNLKGRLPVKSVNEFLTCYLCRGYLIDATTIIECLHSFCKSCIVKYLEGNKYCPICDVQIHKARPLLHVKSDETLQDIVYKLVPGLYAREMKRRRIFYESRPEDAHELLSNEEKGQISEGGRLIFDPEDPISLSIEYYPSDQSQLTPLVPTTDEERSLANQSHRRFYSCPGSVQVHHLKKLIRNKYSLQPKQQVVILYLHDVLKDSYNMMDIAYIYSWKRNEPLRLFFRVDQEPISLPPSQQYLCQEAATLLPEKAPSPAEPSKDCDMEKVAAASLEQKQEDIPAVEARDDKARAATAPAKETSDPRHPNPTAPQTLPLTTSESCSTATSTIPAAISILSQSSSSLTISEVPSPKVAPIVTPSASLVKNGTEEKGQPAALLPQSVSSNITLTTITPTTTTAVSSANSMVQLVESQAVSAPHPPSFNGHLPTPPKTLSTIGVHRPPLIFNKTLAQNISPLRLSLEMQASGNRQLRPKAPPSTMIRTPESVSFQQQVHSHNNGHVAGSKSGKGNHMYAGLPHYPTASPTFINKELAKGLYPPPHPLMPFSTAEQLAKFVSQVPSSYMNSLAFTNPLLGMPPHRFQKEPPSPPTSVRPNSARIKHTPPKNKSSPPTSSYPPGSLPSYKSSSIYSPSLPPPERPPPPPYMLPSPYGLPYGVPTSSSYSSTLPPPYFATPSAIKRLPESPLPPQNKKLKVSQHLGYLLDGHTRKHQVVPRTNGKAIQDKAKHMEMLEHRRNTLALQKSKEASYKELLTSNKDLTEKEKASLSQLVSKVTKASPLKAAAPPSQPNGVPPVLPPKPQVNLNAFPSLAPPPSLAPATSSANPAASSSS